MEAPVAQAIFDRQNINRRASFHRYRGATVEDLDPPPALSTSPYNLISSALFSAWEKDYSHLTVLDNHKRLLGYISIPRLKELLSNGTVKESDPVANAMIKFQRRDKKYHLITMETPLDELEAFFAGDTSGGEQQEFAVVTDPTRRFVLGVATRGDLEEFVKRRPA